MKTATQAKWRPHKRKDGSVRWHKGRIPGTIRISRLPGNSGYHNVAYGRLELLEAARAIGYDV